MAAGMRKRGSKSVVIELSETEGQIDKIERRLETDGRLKLEDENKLLKELKNLLEKETSYFQRLRNTRL